MLVNQNKIQDSLKKCLNERPYRLWRSRCLYIRFSRQAFWCVYDSDVGPRCCRTYHYNLILFSFYGGTASRQGRRSFVDFNFIFIIIIFIECVMVFFLLLEDLIKSWWLVDCWLSSPRLCMIIWLLYRRVNRFHYPVAYTAETRDPERFFFIKRNCVLNVQFEFVKTVRSL